MQRRYISPQNQNTNKKEINPEEVRWIMDKIEKLKKEKQYEKYVKQKTPAHNVWLNMLKAFLLGGLICTVGQIIFHYCEAQGLDQDACSSWTSITLVLISVSPDSPTPSPLPPSNTKKKARSSGSDARSSLLPAPSSCTGYSQAGGWG